MDGIKFPQYQFYNCCCMINYRWFVVIRADSSVRTKGCVMKATPTLVSLVDVSPTHYQSERETNNKNVIMEKCYF